MHPVVEQCLADGGGVATRGELLAVVTRHVLARHVAAGELLRLHPQVFVDARRVEDAGTRRAAALRYCGARAALSHTTGLAAWGLDVPESDALHLVVPADTRRAHGEGLRVHRWPAAEQWRGLVVTRRGLPVVQLERCLVDAWPLLPAGPQRRAPAITAVSSRRTTPARLLEALGAVPKLRDRAELRRLLDRLAAGCRSELELWGFERVFRGRAFADVVRQHRVQVGDHAVYLDVAFPDVKVAVELDGAAWHGSREQRERDIRRDAALAALGWVVLRFSHRRLHNEPDVVRREVLTVLRQRHPQAA